MRKGRILLFLLVGFIVLVGAYLRAKPTKQEPPVYPEVKFDLTPQDILLVCDEAIKGAERRVDALTKEEKPNFENAVLRLENALVWLDEMLAEPSLLKHVSPVPEVREAGETCLNRYSEFAAKLYARSDVYQALKKAESGVSEPVDRKLVEEMLKIFERSGAALSKEKSERIAHLNERISKLGIQFRSHIDNDEAKVELTRAEVEGVPETILSNLAKTPKGKYLLKIMITSHYLAFLQNAKNADARKKVLLARENVQGERNTKILEEVLSLRDEAAKLLGFKNHAHFRLDDRMAKNPEAVLRFLEDLQPKLRQKMDQELEVLLALKKQEGPAAKVEPWDWRYYANQLKKTKYAVDDERVREYFPLNHVVEETFKIYQQLLGVRFHKVDLPSLPKSYRWHEDVSLYEVRDKKSGKVVAHFYMDLFPRPGKYSHFAAFTIKTGHGSDAGYQWPVSAIVGNWEKGAEGKESLLTHEEVETFFHEFGHIMHQTLTRAKYASLAGTNVKQDFVEAPSQMLENWVWQRKILKKLSKHYQTGKPLPDDLIEKMVRAKHLNEGLFWTRQLFYALVDMRYHTEAAKVDTAKMWRKVAQEVMPVTLTTGTKPAATFGHLMGYDASYYGYLWSRVFAQDMFTLFEREGLLSPRRGKRYRKIILEPGNTREPMELIEGFLGRKVSYEAFYKDLGISK